MAVPDVVLSPRVGADVRVVISAADYVEERLDNTDFGMVVPGSGSSICEDPVSCSGDVHVPPIVERKGFTVTERLDGVTLEALRELMRHVR